PAPSNNGWSRLVSATPSRTSSPRIARSPSGSQRARSTPSGSLAGGPGQRGVPEVDLDELGPVDALEQPLPAPSSTGAMCRRSSSIRPAP
ncbi:MAG TPA: hypothetical protein VIV12_18825, partial [Streptosporangiaceae bacterium]